MKTILVWLGIAASLALAIFLLQKNHNYREEESARLAQEEKKGSWQARLANFRQRLDVSQNSTDLEQLKVELKNLPAEYQQSLLPLIELKLITGDFERGEDLIRNAVQLHLATDGNLPEQTDRLMKEAIEFYKNAKKKVDRLGKSNTNREYNYALHLRKGVIYYRVLQLAAKKEEAKELFDQTVMAYRHALSFKPIEKDSEGDKDAEIDLELLLKEMNKLLANANKPGNERIKSLPMGIGSGRAKGNF